MTKTFTKYKTTLSEIIAQHWLFSCNAQDTEATAKEIQRLAKMIDDAVAGKELDWKVINRSLYNAVYTK